MTDCPRMDVRDALPDLVHDQLQPLARERVEHHVAGCAECAAELTLLRSARSALSAAPELNVARLTGAVVRASSAMRDADPAAQPAPAAGGGGGEGASESSVLPISRARATAGPSRSPAWYTWRAAAGIAAVAVGIMGYSVVSGPQRAAVPAPEASAAASGPAPASGSASRSAVATSAFSDMAAAPAAADLAASPPTLIVLGGGINGLSESDMWALLQEVDELEAVPDIEPYPLPALGRVIEGAGAGTGDL